MVMVVGRGLVAMKIMMMSDDEDDDQLMPTS
jgi:hypothetical protein